MNKDFSYTNIDRFRFIAALLVIAIHTSPLLSFSETGDFILTRIIARVAVPFFFMVSGFFLISKYNKDNGRLLKFIKSTLLIYGVAVVFYIPLNIYSGDFHASGFLPEIIKDIVFDGTLYHLWYLPASAMGACIAWFAVKKFGFYHAGLITVALYLTGLLGDSYYGVTEKIPFIRLFYENLFHFFDYTRNGIFFAPIFFVMGGYIAYSQFTEDSSKGRPLSSLKYTLPVFLLSMFLMTAESMLLHKWNFQRHDSMYIMLLPCMYFLFKTIISKKGSRNLRLSKLSLAVYLIHPMVIVFVRLLAKLTSLPVLVENSLLHYIAVSLLSIAASAVGLLIYRRLREAVKFPAAADEARSGLSEPAKISGFADEENFSDNTGEAAIKNFAVPPGTERSWIELNLENLRHNVRVLTSFMPEKSSLMAVVKANAYGHGDFEISTCLEQAGVKAFAVATLDEAIRLRSFGISGEILILGYTHPSQAGKLKKYRLTQTLVDFEYAKDLEENLKGKKGTIKAHIKIDTGFHRLGFSHENLPQVLEVFNFKHLDIRGIFTHLSVSDSLDAEDISFTKLQLSRFKSLLELIKNNGIEPPLPHVQSSYGFLNYPDIKYTYKRIGIALYGILSSPEHKTALSPDLRPVLSLKTRIAVVKDVKPGEQVGYGRTYTAVHPIKIAILPIGYADGFPRSLSEGRGKALIKGSLAPIVGRICMDQLAVDVTHIDGAAPGGIATLISGQSEKSTESTTLISAPAVAHDAGTISNELLSRLGSRLKTVVKNYSHN